VNFLSNFFDLLNSLPEDSVYYIALNALLNNRDQLQNASIYDIAETCNVSRTTINRLFKKLGYKSYKEFRQDMTRAFGKYSAHNHIIPIQHYNDDEDIVDNILGSVEAICAHLRSTIDLKMFSDVLETFHTARKVRFYSANLPGIRTMMTNLAMNGKDARIIELYSEQLIDVQRVSLNTVIFCMDIDNLDTFDMRPIFKTAKDKGATIFMIGHPHHSNYRVYADFYVEGMMLRGSISMQTVELCFSILSTMYRSRYMMGSNPKLPN